MTGRLAVAIVLLASSISAAETPRVHTYSSPESGIFANAYIVETAQSVVVIDATLTVSDARALRGRVDAIGKPLRAVLLTHGHPDHYNGLTNLLDGLPDVPVLATAGVDRVIRENDAAKEAQWKPVFKDEWPARRTFPTRTIGDGDSFSIDGVRFVVHDLGPGESHSDSYWIVEGKEPVAFIGDVVINRMHAYLSDGHSAQWLHNLDRVAGALHRAGVRKVYPGHGAAGSPSILKWERSYLRQYRLIVVRLAHGRSSLSDDEKRELASEMKRFLPTENLAFLIPLGADAVAAELAP